MKFLKQTFQILYGYLNVDEKHPFSPLDKNIHRAGWHENALF